MAVNGEFKIEKGVPMPAKAKQKRVSKYRWTEMEIGDSVFIARPEKGVKVTASLAAKAHGIKLSVRADGDGSRVWRTA